MALGAERERVLRLVMGEVPALAGAGVALGLPVAWWLGRFLESQLFGLRPNLAGHGPSRHRIDSPY